MSIKELKSEILHLCEQKGFVHRQVTRMLVQKAFKFINERDARIVINQLKKLDSRYEYNNLY